MNNKEKQIKLYVILGTIIMLLVIFSGITYAFFSASNNKGSTSIISATSGKMTINYADGKSDLLVSKDIQPSNTILVNKTFTLTGSNTTVGMNPGDGLAMPYKVGVKYTSTFSDGMIHYYIKEINRANTSNVTVNYTGEVNQTVPGNDTYTEYTHGTFKNGKKYTEMVTGVFPALKTDQTITFNLIIQFPDNNENQDSEKGKTFNGKVVVNYEVPQPKSFAEDTWETIAYNTSSNVYNVGDTKTVLIDNKPYIVRIANKLTPTECNDSNFSQTACGFVVEFADIVEKRQMNSTSTNAGGWKDSEMRTYLNGDTDDHMTYNDTTNGPTATFFSKLPKELRDVIENTTVVSGHGSTSGETNFTSTDKIYLLSAHEVWEEGTSNQVSSKDTAWDKTRRLDYYKNLGLTTDSYSGAIKKYNNSNSIWWLRAAASGNYDDFLLVSYYGNWDNINADFTSGFAPAFRIG